jgi:hypothetical protein
MLERQYKRVKKWWSTLGELGHLAPHTSACDAPNGQAVGCRVAKGPA